MKKIIVHLDDDVRHYGIYIKCLKIFDENGNLERVIDQSANYPIKEASILLDLKILPIIWDKIDSWSNVDWVFSITDEKICRKILETIEEHILENA